MPFLLGHEHQMDGTTVLTIDDGPTRRVQLLTLTETAHIALEVPPDQLLASTLRIVPPAEQDHP